MRNIHGVCITSSWFHSSASVFPCILFAAIFFVSRLFSYFIDQNIEESFLSLMTMCREIIQNAADKKTADDTKQSINSRFIPRHENLFFMQARN